jgi:hypothetical protein
MTITTEPIDISETLAQKFQAIHAAIDDFEWTLIQGLLEALMADGYTEEQLRALLLPSVAAMLADIEAYSAVDGVLERVAALVGAPPRRVATRPGRKRRAASTRPVETLSAAVLRIIGGDPSSLPLRPAEVAARIPGSNLRSVGVSMWKLAKQGQLYRLGDGSYRRSWDSVLTEEELVGRVSGRVAVEV